MEIAELVLAYIKVLVSWPLILFALCYIFKDSISKFWERIVEIKAPGGSVIAVPQEQQTELQETDKIQTSDDVGDDPALLRMAYIELHQKYIFERIFSVIFGSQVRFLEHLQNKYPDGENYLSLLGFIEASKTTLDFSSWIKFLTNFDLIESKSEVDDVVSSKDIKVYITQYGINFLNYLKETYHQAYRYNPN